MIDQLHLLCWTVTVSSYRPLTVILYLIFLFLVVIILLNVLIAQVSATYTAVQSTTRASLLFHRSRFITRCEESTALWFLLWTFRWKKIVYSYCFHCDVESQTNANQRHPKVDWHSKWSLICSLLLGHTYLVRLSILYNLSIAFTIQYSLLMIPFMCMWCLPYVNNSSCIFFFVGKFKLRRQLSFCPLCDLPAHSVASAYDARLSVRWFTAMMMMQCIGQGSCSTRTRMANTLTYHCVPGLAAERNQQKSLWKSELRGIHSVEPLQGIIVSQECIFL